MSISGWAVNHAVAGVVRRARRAKQPNNSHHKQMTNHGKREYPEVNHEASPLEKIKLKKHLKRRFKCLNTITFDF